MSQHRATLRRSLQSALAHKRLANEILDSLADSQTQLNAALDKLDADTAGALDTDYEAALAITDVFEADGTGTGAQHRASLRASLQSALAHRRLADEICDAMEELQVAHNALMVKLDAQAGTLTETDFASTLGVEALTPDSTLAGQHKAPVRTTLRSALAHERLADEILDGIAAAQSALNASLALLDAGTVAGAHAALKVDVIDPDA
jgi:hypothetical protein